jgi:hypothetical protein
VKVWCFKATSGLWALTGESSGARLPEDLGPWTLHRAVDLLGTADDEREAITLIEADGYCCFRDEPVD